MSAVCCIPVKHKGKIVGVCKIDYEDRELFVKYRWNYHPDGYLQRNIPTSENGKDKRGLMLLHRQVMNAPKEKFVDHINQNGFDNRKSNLRLCTNRENCRNRKLGKHNKSGKTGVSYDKSTQLWRANIITPAGPLSLSAHTKEAAIKQRIELENKYYGRFAPKVGH